MLSVLSTPCTKPTLCQAATSRAVRSTTSVRNSAYFRSGPSPAGQGSDWKVQSLGLQGNDAAMLRGVLNLIISAGTNRDAASGVHDGAHHWDPSCPLLLGCTSSSKRRRITVQVLSTGDKASNLRKL